MPKKEKVHSLVVKVSFDKPIKRSEAVKELRDAVKAGHYYVGGFSDAEVMKVKGVKSHTKNSGDYGYVYHYYPYEFYDF